MKNLCKGYSEEFVWNLVKNLKKIKMKRGQIVFEAGQCTQTFYILFKGSISIALKLKKQRTQKEKNQLSPKKLDKGFIILPIVDIIPGQLIGEAAFLSQSNQKYTAIVKSEIAYLFKIDKYSLNYIKLLKPNLHLQIINMSKEKEKLFSLREQQIIKQYSNGDIGKVLLQDSQIVQYQSEIEQINTFAFEKKQQQELKQLVKVLKKKSNLHQKGKISIFNEKNKFSNQELSEKFQLMKDLDYEGNHNKERSLLKIQQIEQKNGNLIRGKIIELNKMQRTKNQLSKLPIYQIVKCNQRMIRQLFPKKERKILKQGQDPLSFAKINYGTDSLNQRREIFEKYTVQTQQQNSLRTNSKPELTNELECAFQSFNLSEDLKSQELASAYQNIINSLKGNQQSQEKYLALLMNTLPKYFHTKHEQSDNNIEKRNWTNNIHLLKNKNPFKYLLQKQQVALKHKIGNNFEHRKILSENLVSLKSIQSSQKISQTKMEQDLSQQLSFQSLKDKTVEFSQRIFSPYNQQKIKLPEIKTSSLIQKEEFLVNNKQFYNPIKLQQLKKQNARANLLHAGAFLDKYDLSIGQQTDLTESIQNDADNLKNSSLEEQFIVIQNN